MKCRLPSYCAYQSSGGCLFWQECPWQTDEVNCQVNVPGRRRQPLWSFLEGTEVSKYPAPPGERRTETSIPKKTKRALAKAQLAAERERADNLERTAKERLARLAEKDREVEVLKEKLDRLAAVCNDEIEILKEANRLYKNWYGGSTDSENDRHHGFVCGAQWMRSRLLSATAEGRPQTLERGEAGKVNETTTDEQLRLANDPDVDIRRALAKSPSLLPEAQHHPLCVTRYETRPCRICGRNDCRGHNRSIKIPGPAGRKEN